MKKRTFAHLNHEARDRIEALLGRGHLQQDIAAILKVDKSTISREIRGRKGRRKRYDAKRAEEKARVLRSNSKYQGMKVEAYPELRSRIIEELKAYRSPDEIAGRMKKEKRMPRVGVNAIYKWLRSSLGERYCRYLCTKRKRRKQQRKAGKREMIPNRISIHDKPKRRALELEGDLFVSPKKARTTASVFFGSVVGIHLLLGTKVPDRRSETTVQAVNRSTKEVAPDRIILDNGIENKGHEQFDMDAYFCDPHSPWQKPHVEGDIGLLRRWFIPKGTNLEMVTEKQLQTCLHILNHKYRKSLGYASAYEIALKRSIIETIPKKPLPTEVVFH